MEKYIFTINGIFFQHFRVEKEDNRHSFFFLFSSSPMIKSSFKSFFRNFRRFLPDAKRGRRDFTTGQGRFSFISLFPFVLLFAKVTSLLLMRNRSQSCQIRMVFLLAWESLRRTKSNFFAQSETRGEERGK